MAILSAIKEITRPYRAALGAFCHQGSDILSYVYRYVPRHPELFEPLRRFKGIHQGERCFIVATGPSLTIEDVDKLKNEICWTCNSGVKLFDKTDWRPKYYAIADGTVFRRIKQDIDKVQLNCAFYNHKDIEWEGENVYPLPMWVSMVFAPEVRKVIPRFVFRKRMSSDICKKVYMGGNITNIIIQICFYMGFKEIYLLGCDCNYQGASTHSNMTGYKDADKLYASADDVYRSMIDDHKCALREAKKRGVKIYNATRGGKLEEYERVDLDEVLGLKG